MNLKAIIKMMRDRDGWRRTHGCFDDEVTYRDTGVHFFMDQHGVKFRGADARTVYAPGLVPWFVTTWLTFRLRRYLEAKEAHDD